MIFFFFLDIYFFVMLIVIWIPIEKYWYALVVSFDYLHIADAFEESYIHEMFKWHPVHTHSLKVLFEMTSVSVAQHKCCITNIVECVNRFIHTKKKISIVKYRLAAFEKNYTISFWTNEGISMILIIIFTLNYLFFYL